jgi:hypothetical protein
MKCVVLATCVVLALPACTLNAPTTSSEGALLKFSDGRESLSDLAAINNVLKTVGVRLSRVELPTSALPLLESATRTPLSDEQKARLLEIFSLSRQDVLEEARAAGRQPVVLGGGSMTSGELGVPPYPKVYDLKAMQSQDRINARDKFARLHVNSTDDGVGVDEVMTPVAGGPWTWFFLLRDRAVVELQMSRVEPSGPGWRLSYPGLTPHGGHFHAEDGLCIAYITGPQVWTMRYEAPGVVGGEMLGENPWVDFGSK